MRKKEEKEVKVGRRCGWWWIRIRCWLLFFFIFCCVVVLLLLWLDLTPRGRLLIIIIMKTISKVPQKAL